jgi:hypothetical protein
VCKHNTVYIVNRNAEFERAKEANNNAILEKIEKGEIECFYASNSLKLELQENAAQKAVLTLDTPEGEAEVPCDRIIARLGAIPPRRFIESCGIEFPSEDREAIPELSDQYQTNVPGIYIVGALAGILCQQGLLDRNAPMVEYVPELKRCGYRDASLSHALNMTSGVRFVEEYDHPDSDMRRVDIASGWRPVADDEVRPTIHDIILTLPKIKPHGEAFAYKSIDTDVVAWVLERAASAGK